MAIPIRGRLLYDRVKGTWPSVTYPEVTSHLESTATIPLSINNLPQKEMNIWYHLVVPDSWSINIPGTKRGRPWSIGSIHCRIHSWWCLWNHVPAGRCGCARRKGLRKNSGGQARPCLGPSIAPASTSLSSWLMLIHWVCHTSGIYILRLLPQTEGTSLDCNVLQ